VSREQQVHPHPRSCRPGHVPLALKRRPACAGRAGRLAGDCMTAALQFAALNEFAADLPRRVRRSHRGVCRDRVAFTDGHAAEALFAGYP